MRVNINNTEGIQVKDRDEAVRVIKEKMKVYMGEGDFLGWYKSESNMDEPNIAAMYDKYHREKNSFARIVGNK